MSEPIWPTSAVDEAEHRQLRAQRLSVAREALALCRAQEADCEALANRGLVSAEMLLTVQCMTADAVLQLMALERKEEVA
jgi:hypothetical protein